MGPTEDPGMNVTSAPRPPISTGTTEPAGIEKSSAFPSPTASTSAAKARSTATGPARSPTRSYDPFFPSEGASSTCHPSPAAAPLSAARPLRIRNLAPALAQTSWPRRRKSTLPPPGATTPLSRAPTSSASARAAPRAASETSIRPAAVATNCSGPRVPPSPSAFMPAREITRRSTSWPGMSPTPGGGPNPARSPGPATRIARLPGKGGFLRRVRTTRSRSAGSGVPAASAGRRSRRLSPAGCPAGLRMDQSRSPAPGNAGHLAVVADPGRS